MTTSTIWSCQLSCTNCMFYILGEVDAKRKKIPNNTRLPHHLIFQTTAFGFECCFMYEVMAWIK